MTSFSQSILLCHRLLVCFESLASGIIYVECKERSKSCYKRALELENSYGLRINHASGSFTRTPLLAT